MGADLASLDIRAVVTDEPAADGGARIARYADLVAAGAGAPPPAVALAPDDDACSSSLHLRNHEPREGRAVDPSGDLSGADEVPFEYAGAVAGMTSPETVKAIMALGHAPTMLTAVPLFHVSGLHAHFLHSLRSGRRMVMMYRWDVEEALRLIERERVTAVAASTATTAQLLSAPSFAATDTRSLTAVGLGGAAVTRRVIDHRGEAAGRHGRHRLRPHRDQRRGHRLIGRHLPLQADQFRVRLPIMDVRIAGENGGALAGARPATDPPARRGADA